MQKSHFFNSRNSSEKQAACQYIKDSVDRLIDENFDQLKTILIKNGLSNKEADEVLKESRNEVKEKSVKKFLEKVGEDQSFNLNK